MKAEQRRKAILDLLLRSEEPLSGSALSQQLDVSRQIIVQDIAVLKVSGCDILSTHKGYVLQASPYAEREFKVRHTSQQTPDELKCIIDLGGTVVDVYVWHKVYGRIRAPLNIATQADIDQFVENIKLGRSVELMSVTSGYHYHTIRAASEEILDQIGEALAQRGYIAPGN